MIATAIAFHDGRFGQRPAPLASNLRDGFDERQQLRDVVPVCAVQDHREGDTLRFGEELAL